MSQVLHVTLPVNLQFLSLSLQRDGWHAVLRCDDSWFDDTGQSLFGMAGTGKSEDGPQQAINAAVARINELVAEINEEIPLRKERQKPVKASAEVSDLLGLLGL